MLTTLGKYYDKIMEAETKNSITLKRKKLLRYFIKFKPSTNSMVAGSSQNNDQSFRQN